MTQLPLSWCFCDGVAVPWAVPPPSAPPLTPPPRACRIVNKEWEYSHKRGFRCTFERGILHVYFNFLRTRYRR